MLKKIEEMRKYESKKEKEFEKIQGNYENSISIVQISMIFS